MKLRHLFLSAAMVLVATSAFAANDTASQSVTMTISEMAVLDVTANPGTLTMVAPGTGGATPANPSDSSTYAQYTSTVAAGVTRTITAKWDVADAAPAGTHLALVATPSGGTNEGSTAGSITVSSTAQSVVSGIGSCATGTGATNGAQLAYTLVLDTMTSLVAGESKTATITLTLTDPA